MRLSAFAPPSQGRRGDSYTMHLNSSVRRAPYIDGLRGAAILAVFLHHALAAVCPISPRLLLSVETVFLAPIVYGKYGVAMFFAISGFCIHMSHRRSTGKSWSLFAGQRFFRIYPPYLLALLAACFLPGSPFKLSSPGQSYQFLMHLGLVHNLDARTLYGIQFTFWSIAVEAQLYVVYPLLCWCAARYGWAGATLVAVFVEVTLQATGLTYTMLTGTEGAAWVMASPFAFWGSWAIGALIAEHFMTGTGSPIARMRLDATAAAALILGAIPALSGFAFLCFALATGIAMERLFAACWVLPTNLLTRLLGAQLALLGSVSYSFYLIHGAIVHHAGRHWPNALFGPSSTPVLRFLVACACYPLVLMLSYALYRLVEVPSVRLGKKLMSS